MAKSQLVDEHAENPFCKNCLAEVYVGLSDEEALRLSQRHNQTSHFVHNVTHRDLVGLYMYYPYICVCTYCAELFI